MRVKGAVSTTYTWRAGVRGGRRGMPILLGLNTARRELARELNAPSTLPLPSSDAGFDTRLQAAVSQRLH